MRVSTCIDCGVEIRAGRFGPLPERCPVHKAQRMKVLIARWAADNPESRRASSRRHRRNRPPPTEEQAARTAAYLRKWQAANPDRVRSGRQAWLAANKDVQRRHLKRRKIRHRGAFVEHVEPLAVLELDDGVCGICGEDVDPVDFHVDHIIPLSRGGEHSYANTQPVHPKCNRQKHNSLPKEFA
jgi:5-methylcytosine-specific restriction endonuclease McrA